MQRIENNLLGGHEFIANVHHLCCNVVRDRGDTVEVSMEQVIRIDGEPSHVDRHMDLKDVTVSLRANRAVGKDGKIQGSLTVSRDRLAL
jgi:predicted GTPase